MQSEELPKDEFYLTKTCCGKQWSLYRIGKDTVGGLESPCDVSIHGMFPTKEEALIYCDACGIELTAVG